MATQLASNDGFGLPNRGVSRRQSQRIPTIRRIARISDGRSQGLARLNNISDGGLCLTVPGQMKPDSIVTIHLAEDVELKGKVAWSRGGDCGIILDQAIDCRSVLSAATRSNCSDKRGGLRLNVDTPIQVILHDEQANGRLRELTPHSCKIQGIPALQRGSPLKLLFAPGVVRRGFVCAVEDDGASILFCEAFEVSDIGLLPLRQSADGQDN